MELHTYSSLNENFISEYQNTLKYADEAIVFYSAKAIEIKNINEISFDKIEISFNHKKLNVFNNTPDLEKFLNQRLRRYISFVYELRQLWWVKY